jgi:hypothetical protein
MNWEEQFSIVNNYLTNKYNKNKIAILSPVQQDILDKITEKLNEICKVNNISFNKNGFQTLVKTVYEPNNEITNTTSGIMLKGGDSDDENEEEYKQVVSYKTSKKLILFDFLSVVFFISSIIFFYLAYINLNTLSKDITNKSLNEIAGETREIVLKVIDELNKMDHEEISYIEFMFSILRLSYSELCNTTTERLTNFIKITIVNVFNEYKNSFMEETCRPASNILSEDYGLLASIVNGAANLAQSIASSTSYTQCQQKLLENASDLALAQQRKMINDFIASIFLRKDIIINNIKYGYSFGSTALIYLAYRISCAGYNIVLTKGKMKAIERGGKRKTLKKNKRKIKKNKKAKTNRKKYKYHKK